LLWRDSKKKKKGGQGRGGIAQLSSIFLDKKEKRGKKGSGIYNVAYGGGKSGGGGSFSLL